MLIYRQIVKEALNMMSIKLPVGLVPVETNKPPDLGAVGCLRSVGQATSTDKRTELVQKTRRLRRYWWWHIHGTNSS